MKIANVTSDNVHPNTLPILIPSFKLIMLNWRCVKVNVLCHVTLSCKPEQLGRGHASHWPEATQKAAGPAKAIL